MFRRKAEQALQATAKVGRLADVWLRLRVVAAEEKDGGRGRGCGEEFGIMLRDELQPFGQHAAILV
jgi:hypothetical protein